MEHISIKMLGTFSLQAGKNQISDSDNRSKKVWLLLAYLLCRRGRAVSQKALIDLLWGGDSATSSNPENALKITFHRTRTLLDRLWPNAGHELILHQEGGYAWNPDAPVTMDTAEFERLCSSEGDAQAQLDAKMEALALYRGSFLDKMSSETWVIPIATHIHNQYIETVLSVVPALSAQERHREAMAICRAAVAVEPYHEPLHQLLIRELAAMGDLEGAAGVYKTLSQRLFHDFGIRPGDETRQVYRDATQVVGERSLLVEEVLDHLQEKGNTAGAMECDYDYFKILCHVEARAMERSGKVTYIALLSVTGGEGHTLSSRSISLAAGYLGEQIRESLRRGDTFTRCSASQFIMMLPQANYENSCLVCRRVIGAFMQKHPHTAAKIHFVVQPLGQNALEL